LKAGQGVEKAHDIIRKYAGVLTTDRTHSPEIEELKNAINRGEFAEIVD